MQVNAVLPVRTPKASSSLPHVPPSAKVSPVVHRLLGHNPGAFTLQGTNTYLIGNGRQRFLIDTGLSSLQLLALSNRSIFMLSLSSSGLLFGVCVCLCVCVCVCVCVCANIPGEGKPEYAAALASLLKVENCEISDIICTHHHIDHIGN